MKRRLSSAVAVTALVALGAAACGTPSKNTSQAGTGGGDSSIGVQGKVTDPNAKGPAADLPGFKKGGKITLYSQSTPSTFDPTDIYFTDSGEIAKLLFRTPTQFDIRNGKPYLVPDLTDLGKPSDDKLTWTFKMQKGIKYENGDEVKVEDLAYAIKRSFAKDLFINGPSYQLTYFKDGDKYKGPYKDGDKFKGVKTEGDDTLIIKLRKPFPDIQFYMSFAMFTPIPKAKDTKSEYKNKPLATGPYKFASYTPGSSLKLVKNTNWDANTDAARHQYPDSFDFKWGQDAVKTQQQVLNSNGDDANALDYTAVDASLSQSLKGAKASQLLQGDSPCNVVTQMDTRKIPLEVRKAIAKAYPYDAIYKSSGSTELTTQAGHTILPPSVPGYKNYDAFPDLSGIGAGDPDGAKKMLEAAGKSGFELSWYYDNTKPIPQQVNQVKTDALTKAGFKVKAIGVPTAGLRTKKGDYKAPVNMGQSPGGWCSDWPSGGSWFPVLFKSQSIEDGQSWGMLSDPELDKKIDAINDLGPDKAMDKWADLDKEIMGKYVALPLGYDKMAIVIGSNIGGGTGDPTFGMPLLPNLFLKS